MQTLTVDAFGVAIGLAAALVGARLVTSLLCGVSPHDPVLLAVVSGTMLLVGLAASILPVVQALSVDTLEALRAE